MNIRDISAEDVAFELQEQRQHAVRKQSTRRRDAQVLSMRGDGALTPNLQIALHPHLQADRPRHARDARKERLKLVPA